MTVILAELVYGRVTMRRRIVVRQAADALSLLASYSKAYDDIATCAGASHPGAAGAKWHCHLKADVFSMEVCGSWSHCGCSCVDTIHRPLHAITLGDSFDWSLPWGCHLCAFH